MKGRFVASSLADDTDCKQPGSQLGGVMKVTARYKLGPTQPERLLNVKTGPAARLSDIHPPTDHGCSLCRTHNKLTLP